MRRALTAALLAAPVAFLAACSAAPAPPPPPPPPPVQMITVTVGASQVETMVYTDPASANGVTSAPK
jgi:hypothetical protein